VVDASTPSEDAQAPEPDAQAPEPDAQVPEPDAQAPEPDAQAPEPDAQAPEPDAQPGTVTLGGGVLVFELASDFLDMAGAGARFTDPVLSPEPEVVHGPCVVTESDPDAPEDAPLFGYDAGQITVTGTDPAVTLTTIDEGAAGTGYDSGLSEDLEALLPSGGALLTVVGGGGQDLPAFTAYVQVPEPVTLTSPATGIFKSVDASSDLTVSWNVGTGESVLVTMTPLSATYQPIAGKGLVCGETGDPGVMQIPATALSAVKSSGVGTVAIGVTRIRTSTTNAGEWVVPVTVTRSTGGPVGID